MKSVAIWTATLALAAALCACSKPAEAPVVYHGDDVLPNGSTIKQVIETRQHNLKDLGGAFKAVNDQLKLDAPQIEQIKLAAAEVKSHSQEMPAWFPAKTGPDSGVKTDALAKIWDDEAAFKTKVEKFAEVASKLDAAAQSGDLAVIKTAAQETGASCKACHDPYRRKDD